MSPRTRANWFAVNPTRKCSHPSCSARRRRPSGWCSIHERRVRLYGHAEGRPLPNKELASYRRQIAAFLNKHADTVQVTTAVKLCADWLRADGFSFPGTAVAEQVRRFKREEVEARELLEQVGAVFSLAYHQPRVLPDAKRLIYGIGYAVLHIRPLAPVVYWSRGKQAQRGRVIGSVVRREIGGFFHRSLAGFFANIMATLEREHQRTVETNLALTKPFAE
jgi:hypothetical protein